MEASEHIKQLVVDFQYIKQTLKERDNARVLLLLQIGLMRSQHQVPFDTEDKSA